jgi:glycosyltransferase involved in cell wall biosynthesis
MDVRLLVDRASVTRDLPGGMECRPVDHRHEGRLMIPAGIGPLVKDSDVLVIHGGWTAWTLSAARQATAYGVPYVVTTHGVYYPQTLQRRTYVKKLWNHLLERRHLDRALALHLFFVDEADGLRQLGISASTIVAPNGVPIHGGVRWDGGTGGYLLWLGRFDPQVKGLDLLLRSLLLFPEEARPPLRLHGPEFRGNRERLTQLAGDLELTKWVSIGDAVYGEEKWRLMAQAAGFVYPSRWDASPMAVAEAIGVGIPTLVADYPLGRLLASEGAALLCERSPRRIADGIQGLLSEEAAALSARAEEVARGRLSWGEVATSWITQVDRLLNVDIAR